MSGPGMTGADEARRVAMVLTKAQVAYLTTKAEWRKPRPWSQERWMTFPPANTHRVLMDLGLVGQTGTILDAGLAVRSHLERTEDV